MSIRATYRTTGEMSLPPRFSDDTFAPGRDADGRGAFDEVETGFDAAVRDAPAITEILRDSDLDALLHGVTGSEFLFEGRAVELPFAGGNDDFLHLPDLPAPIGKLDTALVLPGVPDQTYLARDADIAQVLPGIMGDEFLLSKDADLPLVLPDDGSEVALLETTGDAEALAGFPSHMLTLHPEDGFMDGTDDIGRLHDHDGWLF